MAFINRPDKITVTSFADPNLDYNTTGGTFWSFKNDLQTPLLNVKGIQLLTANFVNPSLQLNDYSQLMFFYYAASSATAINVLSNLRCVRLHPSWFYPASGYTGYVLNQYFTDGAALCTALNTAAAAGGDSVTYNPKWVAGDVSFNFNTSTRKISLVGGTASTYYTPAAADDPVVTAYLATNAITMYSQVGTGSAAVVQPYISGYAMNTSLGFAMSFTNTGRNWGTGSYQGCAWQVGYPLANGSYINADSWPILLGVQNVRVYCSVVAGSGVDSGSKKNLLASIPVSCYALNVNAYTLTSVKSQALSVNNEIYTLQFDFRDDNGNPVWFNQNMSVSMELAVYYSNR